MNDSWHDLVDLPDPNDPNAVVKAFAANPAFRAAEWSELTCEDNPFRRPVRPDDLGWLDYGVPMRAENALKLSGLLGHRMLRNVYDLDQLLLPPQEDPAVTRDRDAYYSTRSRVLAQLARPVLERHLFTHLEQQRPEPGRPTLDALRARVLEQYDRRSAEPGAAFAAARAARGRREAGTFLLLQYGAFEPAAAAALATAALGEVTLAHPGLRTALLSHHQRWVQDADRYAALLAAAELRPAPAAYWQLSLNSSFARGNHLHHLALDRRRPAAFLGALLFHLLDTAATREPYAQTLQDTLGTRPGYFEELRTVTRQELGELVDTLLAPLCARYGPTVIEQAETGLADAARLAGQWDEDLAAQLTWADSIEQHQRTAERIQQHIDDQGLEIDLDTFVESWEVTSTTHVHDEHRLVVIESGQMHFWNNVTHKIELNAGDKLLIPLSRLHGSTVLSGECTYHQPIIPDAMFRQFS
ncbi:hypothetical protein [Kitasatospora sp. MBT63]|uniref:hypothetical protein n=1 Tax=Kitasatospora sp. MBT63 TaxID=1444768 RepID=UPI00068ED887|nr:hypothetical protein [Kitasatospora sp. MBT63]